MLLVRLEAGSDTLLYRTACGAACGECAEVLALDICERGGCRTAREVRRAVGGCAAAITSTAVEGRNDGAEILCVECEVAVLPVLATKGTDREIQLHGVVELAIVTKDLPFAVPEYIPRYTDTWGNLIAPAEVDWFRERLTRGAYSSQSFAGKIFLVDTNSVIDR